MLATSCKHNTKDPTDYVGNWDGKDWIGYQSGSLLVNEVENGVVSIVSNDHYQANNLIMPNKIKLSDGQIKTLTNVSDNAFKNNTSIVGHITLANTLNEIGDSAFYQCSGLSGDLNIPNSVTDIGEGAFYGCSSLNGNLTLSSNLQVVQQYAFEHCSFSGSLIIPNGMTIIAGDAFKYSTLRTFDISNNNTCEFGISSIGGTISYSAGTFYYSVNQINLGIRDTQPSWTFNGQGAVPFLCSVNGNVIVSGSWSNKETVISYLHTYGVPSTGWTVNGE